MQFPETDGRQALYRYTASLQNIDKRLLTVISERGTTWTALDNSPPLPIGTHQGDEKKCYDNALNCLVGDIYIGYVFAVASTGILSTLPIEHAWNATDGSLVDTTLRASPDRGYWYIGVKVSRLTVITLIRMRSGRAGGAIEAFLSLTEDVKIRVLRDISSAWMSVPPTAARLQAVHSGLKDLTDGNACVTDSTQVVDELATLIRQPYASVWDCSEGKNRFAVCAEVTSAVLRVLLPLTASYLGRGREEIFSRATITLYAYLHYTELSTHTSTSESVPATLREPNTLNPNIVESALTAFSLALYYEQKQTQPNLLEKMTNVLASDPALQLIIYANVTRSSLESRSVAMSITAPLYDETQKNLGKSVLQQALPVTFYNVIDCTVWKDIDAGLRADPMHSEVQTLRSALSALLIFAAVDAELIKIPPWIVASAIAILLVEMHSTSKRAINTAQLLGSALTAAQQKARRTKHALVSVTVRSISLNSGDIIKVSDVLARNYFRFYQRADYESQFRRYLLRAPSVEDGLPARTDRDLAALENFIASVAAQSS